MTSSISSAVRELQAATTKSAKNLKAQGISGDFMELISALLGISEEISPEALGNSKFLDTLTDDQLMALWDKLKEKPTDDAMQEILAMLFNQNIFSEAMSSDDNAQLEALGAENNNLLELAIGEDNHKIKAIFQKLSQGESITKEERELADDFIKSLDAATGKEIIKKLSKAKEIKAEVVLPKTQEPKLQAENTKTFLDKKALISKIKERKPSEKAETIELEDIKPISLKEFQAKEISGEKTKSADGDGKVDRFSLTNQIRDGIISNMGRKRFTIRLKPEGIGDITVNMTKLEGGKLSLSILASNKELAEALEENMARLQTALKPLGAEVIQQEAQKTPMERVVPVNDQESQAQNQQKQNQENKNNGSDEENSDGEDFESIKEFFESLSQREISSEAVNI